VSLPQILLINPNTSVATTVMMVAIARACVPQGIAVRGATATRGPAMIATREELDAAADAVVETAVSEAEIAVTEGGELSGIIVGAFGDPGLEALRSGLYIPAVGICEAAMLEAAAGGRRFGIATVTPELVEPITARARDLGLAPLLTGIRLTPGDPLALTADPARLQQCLADAVAQCFDADHAEAVIIGGGPLGQAAIALAPLFDRPIIAPIPAAVRRLVAMMGHDKA
jgi:Asp/Glu/hydantoin racemase